MSNVTKPRVVALEEHYWDPEVVAHFAAKRKLSPEMRRRLEDLGALRLSEMDEAGIDLQVLSHGEPGPQCLDAETSVRLSRQANDRLHEAIQVNPDRFAGFAMLPTQNPKGAAEELERSVTKLGFKGAMVHGLTNGRFLDDKEFWPIFEQAEALDVPLYMHPASPHPAVMEAYYKDYAEKFPIFARAAWGFAVEAGTQGIRLILSGVFDRYPRLKIILGHLGEGLPFLLWRIDQALSRPGNSGQSFREYFCKHFYVTTSGNFSTPALLCCIMEIGAERVLFSVDWPFVSNTEGMKWMADVPLCADDKEKILGANAMRLLCI